MIAPDDDDPPELEFYKMQPLRVGSTSRVVAHTLIYAPSPQEDLGPECVVACFCWVGVRSYATAYWHTSQCEKGSVSIAGDYTP